MTKKMVLFIFAALLVCAYTAGSLRAEPAAAISARPSDIDAKISADVRLRIALSLPSARAYVEGLYALAGPTQDRSLGALFTPSEAVEVMARGALREDSDVLHQFVRANALGPVFGGAFVDNAAGGKLAILLCSPDSPVQFAELLRSVPHPARLDLRTCAYSEEDLATALGTLSHDIPRLASEGVQVVSAEIDVPGNRLAVRVIDPSPPSTQMLKRYHPSVTVLPGSPVVDLVGTKRSAGPTGDYGQSRQNDRAPHSAGIEIHSEPPVIFASCTLGFAIVLSDGSDGSLSAGHCGDNGDVWSNGFAVRIENTAIGSTNYKNLGGNNDTMHIRDQFVNGNRRAAVYTDYPDTVHVSGRFDADGEVLGTVRCLSGAQSAYHCGVLESKTANTNFLDTLTGNMVYLSSQRRVCDGLPAVPGDSGGPVWHPSGSAIAAGTLSSGDSGATTTPCGYGTTTPSTTFLFYNWYYSAVEYQLHGATIDTT